MKIIHTNQATFATITASSATTGYPASNVVLPNKVQRWRPTGLSTEWVKFDLGAALHITGFALIGHNFTAGATVKLQANSSDAWVTPAFELTVAIKDIIWGVIDQTYQWWRVLITDASNPAGYVEFGYALLGTGFDPGEEIDGIFSVAQLDDSIVSFSRSGQVYGDVGLKYKQYTFSMGIMGNDARKGIMAVFNSVGLCYPMVFVPMEHDEDTLEPIFAVFMNKPRFDHRGGWAWGDPGFELREVF